MSRYLKTAAEANVLAKQLIEFIYEDADRPCVAELIARLVNLGIRCSPRGVHHTIRLNAVREAVKGLPVRVGMVEKVDDITKRTYHALTTIPQHPEANGIKNLIRVEEPSED